MFYLLEIIGFLAILYVCGGLILKRWEVANLS